MNKMNKKELHKRVSMKMYMYFLADGVVYFDNKEIITKKEFINTLGKHCGYKLVKQAIQEVETNHQTEVENIKLKNEIEKLKREQCYLRNEIQNTIKSKNEEIQYVKNQANQYIDTLVSHIIEKELNLDIPKF